MAAQMPPGAEIGGSDLPDGTSGANAVAKQGLDIAAGDMKDGYHKVGTRIPLFSEETTGSDPVGDPLTFGGFLGRPQGWQR